jgi:PAS domain S-box-containing protein
MSAPHVLIIDDEVTIHNTMKKALKNDNFELTFAGNGMEGLENLQRSTPDLVFLDLSMPVMDGFDFLDSISIQPDDPYLVVVITGHGDDHDVKKSFAKGVNFFLRKPLSMTEVSCLAKRCIAMKSIEREIREHRDNLEQMVAVRTETINNQLHFQQNLIDSIPTPVFFKDRELTYIGCNVAFAEYMNCAREQILGKSEQDIMSVEDAELHHKMDLQTLKKKSCAYESTISLRDGGVRRVTICKAVFKNIDSTIGGLIGTIFDITERKKAEDKLMLRSRELEEANAALRVVLNQIGDAKREVEKRILRNTRELVIPDLDRLKGKCTGKTQKDSIERIKTSLGKLTSSSVRKTSAIYLTMSPREIQITDLIRMGNSTKSIALMLNITESAVEFHRHNIRKKMGIQHQQANLRAYLMNMD